MLFEGLFLIITGTILLYFLSWLHPEPQDDETPLNSPKGEFKKHETQVITEFSESLNSQFVNLNP